jgi:maltose O-acetyltransferase
VRSLNRFRKLRRHVLDLRRRWLVWRGSDIHPTASISLSANLVPGERAGITVGAYTLVAFKSLLIARLPDGRVKPIRIGSNCFIGGGAVVLPGVTIGNSVVVGAGAVVDRDIPDGCLVAGNPLRVLANDIDVGQFGRFSYADANQIMYWKPD